MKSVYALCINDNLYDAMERLIAYLDLPNKLRKICIKLNLCEYRHRETGATSDPQVVEVLLKTLRQRYASSEIYLVENDATGVSADNIFEFLKVDKLAAKYDCRAANVARLNWIEKTIKGLHFEKIDIPELLEECDLFITHPKLKTHGGTKMSCGLKNQFGLLRQKRKIEYHSFLDEAIVDANLGMRPQLSIVDANICMEGNGGPVFGLPRKLGLLIGGADTVAVDSFCAKLIGFDPYFIGHIRKAARRQIGQMSYHLVADFDHGDYKKYRLRFSHTLFYLLKFVRRELQR